MEKITPFDIAWLRRQKIIVEDNYDDYLEPYRQNYDETFLKNLGIANFQMPKLADPLPKQTNIIPKSKLLKSATFDLIKLLIITMIIGFAGYLLIFLQIKTDYEFLIISGLIFTIIVYFVCVGLILPIFEEFMEKIILVRTKKQNIELQTKEELIKKDGNEWLGSNFNDFP